MFDEFINLPKLITVCNHCTLMFQINKIANVKKEMIDRFFANCFIKNYNYKQTIFLEFMILSMSNSVL